MHTYLDAKTMAKALRQGLGERNIALTHSDCLELVSRQFGFANWNMLAARIEAAQLPTLELPPGWFIAQHSRYYYNIGLDPAQPGVAMIAALSDATIPPDQTGVMMQSIEARPYSGQKLRFSAELRSELVGWGSIWMRVDPEAGKYLRFDNMQRRGEAAMRGSRDWKAVDIVLEVPEGAASIHYGLLQFGGGRLWARNLRLEPVSGDFPVTAGAPFAAGPTNLGFAARGAEGSAD